MSDPVEGKGSDRDYAEKCVTKKPASQRRVEETVSRICGGETREEYIDAGGEICPEG